MARVAVVVNPYAGRGRGERAGRAALAHLRRRGAEVRAYRGGSAAETRALTAEALAERPDALVLVGGDGTLSGVLDLVLAAVVPLVLVPAGTGNDLARTLGIPFGRREATAAERAAEAALTGRPARIDVGEIAAPERTALFLTVAALGFDARVSDRTNRLRWPHGRLRYYLALAVELARLRPTLFTVSVDDDGAVPRPGTIIAIGNARSYGGGMPVCPDADPADGLLDVTLVAPLGRLRLIRLFPLLLQGRHGSRDEVRMTRARRVRVDAPDLLAYADGERVGGGPIEVTVRPGALRMLLPARASAGGERRAGAEGEG